MMSFRYNIRLIALALTVGLSLFRNDKTYGSGIEGYVEPTPGVFQHKVEEKFITRITYEFRPGYVARTDSFLKGNNYARQPFGFAESHHLKLSFQAAPGTLFSKLYASSYQGIGISYNDLGHHHEIGMPWGIYVFQGARIVNLFPVFSLFYEWNFGISSGWLYSHKQLNPYNTSISSRTNAYLNVNLIFLWSISRTFDLSAGFSLTHFSNGNTRQPNSGVNIISGNVGLTYNFGRDIEFHDSNSGRGNLIFSKNMVYEIVAFGSWKRRGILKIGQYTSEVVNSKPFGIAGISFAAMYNMNHRLRLGAALDLVYDASANVTYDKYQYAPKLEYHIPPFGKRVSAGIAAKFDYVMPYFTVSLGLGIETLRVSEDYSRFYQSLTLKTDLTERLFLNLGYRIRDFSLPSFLMLGVGYRFGKAYR
ncbi:MAG: acyloxyacyl hydrolase [Rikenellaceae bacterium]|nr:acyloxyacyl hydrolase [Rikenellaceae bacterium]